MNTDSRVLSELRHGIQAGEWEVGDRLPAERALTQRFQTSRVVVREALAALKSLGMIESRKGSGAYVMRTSPVQQGLDITAATHAEILDCLELRRAVEVEAVRLAALRAKPLQIGDIANAIAEMHADVKAGRSGADADWRFHLAVAAATNNPFFSRTMKAFGPEAIPRIRHQVADDTGTGARRELRLISEHESILNALTAQDPDAAADAMRRHLSAALERYQSIEAF